MEQDFLVDKINNVIFNFSKDPPDKKELIITLHRLGVVQFGSFTLKSGLVSPLYLDFRKLFTYPQILKQILELMWKKIEPLPFDVICGVPLTALVFASWLSLDKVLPMVVYRKEKKQHGTGKRVEGEFFGGQRCLIVEDVITSGISFLETAQALEEEGLEVGDVVILIDREQGGVDRVENKGYRVHSIFSLGEVLDTLLIEAKITPEEHISVCEFMQVHRI